MGAPDERGTRAEAVLQKKKRKQRKGCSVMDPDGFGFDSLVNYVGDSRTQMNSPKCEAGHLIIAGWKIETGICSRFSGPPKERSSSHPTGGWAAAAGWMRRTVTGWMNRWNGDGNDEQRGRCRSRRKALHVDPEIIVLKRPEWAQCYTCAGQKKKRKHFKRSHSCHKKDKYTSFIIVKEDYLTHLTDSQITGHSYSTKILITVFSGV